MTKNVFSAGRVLLAIGVLAAGTLGCSSSALDDNGAEVTWDFSSGDKQGWQGAYSDYSAHTDVDYEFVFEARAMPAEVGSGKGLYLSGHNRSDDLFVYLKRRVTGLAPNTRYRLTFEVQFASNAPTGCIGIGGAPGEAVYVKGGAALVEPKNVEEDDWFVLNVDKGNQAQAGKNAAVLGDVANGDSCTNTPRYRLLARDNAEAPLEITTDANGALWLFVGTDSGFEGATSLYYRRLKVTFQS